MNKIERLTKSSDLLRTFVTVAECQNLTIAADSLGRTQSAISVQTKKLEDALEVRLFDRQARGML
ncbi:MAG: LysR family transcriptional regulator, partial [Pseudomonadota bacterium]